VEVVVELPGEVRCLRCQGEVANFGTMPLIMGEHSAARTILLGQLGELAERTWSVSVLRCRDCRHVELFDLNDYPADRAAEAAPPPTDR
jgi:hypothetical protein